MSQSTYTQDFQFTRAGKIFDSRPGNKNSYISEDSSSIEFGRGVALGTDPAKQVKNYYTEIATVVYDADFVSLNSIAFSVNGVAITPVVFDTDQATTMAALVAAVDGLTGVDAVATDVSGDNRTIQVTRRVLASETSADIVVTSTVTLGVSQASATITNTTDQLFGGIVILKQNEDGVIAQYEDLGAMTVGAVTGELVTGQTPAVGGAVYVVNQGSDRGKFSTVDDATTELVSSAKFKSTASVIESKTVAVIEINQP
jgi:hypothetical protein